MMIDMLECTLWQRQLGALPEETVSALVAQVRGGCRLNGLFADAAADSAYLLLCFMCLAVPLGTVSLKLVTGNTQPPCTAVCCSCMPTPPTTMP